ncbi:MAG TPA: hypothetical protein VGB73_10965 [Pyrinomonadaceae bacterium]|jgi:hypothetical protein
MQDKPTEKHNIPAKQENETPAERAQEWSESQSLMLRHEEFIAEVMRRRRPEETSGTDTQPQKTWKQILFETSGGTALINVIIGGAFVTIISILIQQGFKEREVRQAYLKASSEQALLAYKEYSDREQEIVKEIYEVIGKCISSSDDIIDLTRPEFDPEKYPTQSLRDEVTKDAVSLQEKYSEAATQWRASQAKLKLLIAYYHPSQPEVTNGWDGVQKSLTAYMKCARLHTVNSPKSSTEQVEGACKPEKEELYKHLAAFTSALEKSRHYPWKVWESPEKLRDELEK